MRGHRHRRPAQGPRPLPGDAAARAARHGRRSPGTARPTARRSTTSTSSTAATGSSWRCRTGASPTASSARGSSRRPRPRSPTASATTAWSSPPATRCTRAAQRIVVFARLEQAEARGPARRIMEFPELKRGGHPIIHPASDDDLSHMTVLELRYASRHRVVRVPGSTRSRFGRDVHGDRVNSTPMTDSRMSKMEEIRDAPRARRLHRGRREGRRRHRRAAAGGPVGPGRRQVARR